MNRNTSDHCKIKFQANTELYGHMNEEHTDETNLYVKNVIKNSAQLEKNNIHNRTHSQTS